VAENGAVLYDPRADETRELGEPPPQAFIEALEEKGLEPLSAGHVIVATEEPHHTTVVDTIRELGLELQVIFNKGAVMVLPSGMNKATGLLAALDELGLSPHNVVGIGDAENDHAFLDVCEFSVAVANALPAVKERCDHVTEGQDGDGVAELIEAILDDDLAALDERVGRHDLTVGVRKENEPVTLRPHRQDVLVVGPSGSGKSTLTTGVLERLRETGYQFLLSTRRATTTRSRGSRCSDRRNASRRSRRSSSSSPTPGPAWG
jgi:hydroxymethylpyrimidine pyrophosphatase-like HAD family hydrolase